ncbi:hypothetical protein QCE62_19525 [Caballeronia sp. LZ033]|uniref:hypothetical protein n=1 Tax=Caballeronia sp. LZ033 TaxID=3038566 RepID=UPI00286263E2|nr:hypothetical protein [Caballeronia sp. LZ033]MDR5815780.1 hypothetical protein [Caballeronia sp. LZ033]
MTTIYVQFSDDTDTTIISYFSCPQDPDVWANQGTIDSSDPRWKVYFDAQSPFIQGLIPNPD